MLAAWAASSSCSRSMHVPTDGWFSLSSVWKPLFHASVKLLVRFASDVVNVPDAGRECWSSTCSVSRSNHATDRLKSQIEIVDQRLWKRRHYSAQKVHAGLCRIKSTSQSFVFSVKRSSYFSLWQKKLCNLTEKSMILKHSRRRVAYTISRVLTVNLYIHCWNSSTRRELPLSDSWDSFFSFAFLVMLYWKVPMGPFLPKWTDRFYRFYY